MPGCGSGRRKVVAALSGAPSGWEAERFDSGGVEPPAPSRGALSTGCESSMLGSIRRSRQSPCQRTERLRRPIRGEPPGQWRDHRRLPSDEPASWLDRRLLKTSQQDQRAGTSTRPPSPRPKDTALEWLNNNDLWPCKQRMLSSERLEATPCEPRQERT